MSIYILYLDFIKYKTQDILTICILIISPLILIYSLLCIFIKDRYIITEEYFSYQSTSALVLGKLFNEEPGKKIYFTEDIKVLKKYRNIHFVGENSKIILYKSSGKAYFPLRTILGKRLNTNL
jgi:hypothetical protein